MNGKKGIRWCSLLILLFSVVGCGVKRPDTVLTDAKMEGVLYDYHLAKAMGEEVPYNESYKKMLYVQAAFEKHGITQAQFDSSMVWFARNPAALTKIYEKVNARLKAEKENLSNLIALRDNKPRESQPGDSIDVWQWRRIYQLAENPLGNKMTFVLPSDTNFYERDTLCWSVRFRFPGGSVDSLYAPLMAMQILYASDSLVGSMCRIQQEGTETIVLSADTLGAIKEIRGFIYCSPRAGALLADRISLMRYHAKDSLNVVAHENPVQPVEKEKKEQNGNVRQPVSQPLRALPDKGDNVKIERDTNGSEHHKPVMSARKKNQP